MEKMYNTRQKVLILEMLKQNSNRHLTVDEMMMIFTAKKTNVSRATLYRYLDALVQTGEVRKYQTSELDKACYQYIDKETNCKEHFHLMCIECGSLKHLECDKISDLVSHIEIDHKFKVDPGRIVIYGICENCTKEDI